MRRARIGGGPVTLWIYLGTALREPDTPDTGQTCSAITCRKRGRLTFEPAVAAAEIMGGLAHPALSFSIPNVTGPRPPGARPSTTILYSRIKW